MAQSYEILTVEDAKYVKDYVLRIRFSNGVEKLYDFSKELSKGICTKLRDIDYFKNSLLIRLPLIGTMK